MEAIRVERQRLMLEEILGALRSSSEAEPIHQRSRKLSRQARQEMALQETWTAEIREVYARAALENIDLSRAGEEKASVDGEESPGEEEVSREEVLNRQLLHLTHSMQKSERRLQTLLDTLRSLPTLSSTQATHRRLHKLATHWTNQLVEFSFKRQQITQDLEEMRRERAAMEDKRDLIILDLVLDWNSVR
ncbi:hypothetical protein JCM10296v2_001985 [Rhodotorula toruloides]